MLIAVLMLCGLGVYILSPHLESGHFNRTPGRRPTFATVLCVNRHQHMAEPRLPPPPAPVAAPILEHAAVDQPPIAEEPPVDPVLAPPPAPVPAADPAPAVETVEEVIFLVFLLLLSQVYVFYRVFPLSVALVPTFVSGLFVFSFSVLLSGFISVNRYTPFCFMLCIVLGLFFPRVFACLCGPLLRFWLSQCRSEVRDRGTRHCTISSFVS